jgi:hypothetical protein
VSSSNAKNEKVDDQADVKANPTSSEDKAKPETAPDIVRLCWSCCSFFVSSFELISGAVSGLALSSDEVGCA